MIAHDVEIVKNGVKYRVSDNPLTYNHLRVIDYNVIGAGYERDYSVIDGIDGRFHNYAKEEHKKVELRLRYEVPKIAYASHLKSDVQTLFYGRFYLRELATPNNTIKFESIFEPLNQEFELDYVDGRQLLVGLVSEVSFDTTQTSGEFTLTFETTELPFFESIGYSTDLESDNDSEKWSVPDRLPTNEHDKRRQMTFHNTNSGDVYYNGDVPLTQFNQFNVVEIELAEDVKADDKEGFTFYTDKGNISVIKDVDLKAGDKIIFDGKHTYRGRLNIDFANKTLEQPVLYPGWNRFKSNKVMKKITFTHKLYYR
ncbi:TPA: phage tail family protein [Staphylococcus aureus]|uniref:phage tail domain-containing protein n=1 Tax=Staphylococcus aureus TaxID=1280 RepID=UPI0007665F15|nr:phage tail domain-containing protein [Staphylococcus aureus]MRV53361.1 phage tail protein [Staphylococcus aureus]CAC5558568.1 phage tail protein [Staphylococcus aureus]CAC5708241.1 phage tail protein [Staphylococcus aureus]CAC5709921.1 phage tail protein [Staphylococcus aureus]CAC5800030.1 phage tail protein [Staphylococcus aureus]